MQRFLAMSGVVCALAFPPGAVRAESGAGANDPHLHAAAKPGDFCALGACRPLPSSPWNGAAFGAAVLAIGWRARRSPRTDA